jgi:putative transposase
VAVIQEAYVHGISTRSVDDLVKAMGAGGMSKSQVSRLCAEIDERVNAFLTRPLEGAWPYLWLDATYVKVREGGRIVSRAVIIAVAVNDDGKREVLGVATGPSEAETFWTDFLRSLADRGLRGVKLVIADDHKGLRAAARRVFNATHQRCRIHWMRNALAHAPTKARRPDGLLPRRRAGLHVLPARALGADRQHEPARAGQPRDQATRRRHRHLPQRRRHRPPRRRADAGDNDEWAVARRYMSLETLARITDNPNHQAARRGRLISLDLSEGRRSYTTPRDMRTAVQNSATVAAG